MLHFSFLRCRLPAALIVALLGLLLGGCETQSVSLGKKIDYKSATTTAPLEIPPDLTTPTYDDRYLATTASGAAAARAAGKASDILPPNPDAHLARAGSERWLVVKATPEAAWTTLSEFWPANGFVLAVQQPTLGIMETDWAENRASAPRSWLGQFFDKYVDLLTDTYRRDKFRSRIEQGSEAGTVEIYITHYGAVQVPTKPDSRLTKYGDDFQWTADPAGSGTGGGVSVQADAEVRQLAPGCGERGGGVAQATGARAHRKGRRRGEPPGRRRQLRSRLAPRRARARPYRLHRGRPRSLQGPLFRPLFQS